MQAGRGSAWVPFDGQRACVRERIEVVQRVRLLSADEEGAPRIRALSLLQQAVEVVEAPVRGRRNAENEARSGKRGGPPTSARRPGWRLRVRLQPAENAAQNRRERHKDPERLQTEVEGAVYQDGDQTGDQGCFNLVTSPITKDAPSDEHQTSNRKQEEEQPAAVDEQLQRLV